jgi:microcystin degradation protein MlrC
MNRKRRVGIGGIATESCTFSPLNTTIDDFTIWRGDGMQEIYPYLPAWIWRDRDDIAFIPCLKAWATPGGQVTSDAYAEMKAELLERIEAALPLDGFFLDIHGAMSVLGLDDAEGDLATAIRALVGPDCVISAGMDLHGNITEQLVSQVDVFTCYRHAPHIDALETKERAVAHLVHLLDTGIRPHRAFVRIPVMLPGERTSTVVEPGRSVYGRLAESDGVAGVIDPSLWVGYVWADQPRTNAAVVVTGTDVVAISREAERIARRYWDARHDFSFEVPTGDPDWAIDEALKLDQTAVFISDAGDNITAGGAGDSPFMISRLLTRKEFTSGARTAIVAAIPNTEAVRVCIEAGVGSEVTVSIGGMLDPVNGVPLDLRGTVSAIQRDDPEGGDTAVVRCGGIRVAVTSRRKVFFHRSDFEAVGLDVDAHHLTVVKVGYLFPDQRAMASAAFMALSPGAVNLDIPSLPYHRVQRPIYPLDPRTPDPDLAPMCFAPIGG